jgi:hypothetical protein
MPRTLGIPRRRALLSALICLVALAGCYPAPTIVGRGANVMDEGEGMGGFGAGLTVWNWETIEPEKDEGTLGLPYVTLRGAGGIGHRMDVEIAWTNFVQVEATLRYQPFGPMDRLDRARNRIFPPVFSIEVGGFTSANPFADSAETDTEEESDEQDDRYLHAGGHVGVNASFTVGPLTIYAAYRHHAVYYSNTQDEFFEHQTYHAGLEWLNFMHGRFVVEAFYGRSPHLFPEDDEVARESFGVNVIWSGFNLDEGPVEQIID